MPCIYMCHPIGQTALWSIHLSCCAERVISSKPKDDTPSKNTRILTWFGEDAYVHEQRGVFSILPRESQILHCMGLLLQPKNPNTKHIYFLWEQGILNQLELYFPIKESFYNSYSKRRLILGLSTQLEFRPHPTELLC